jgi:hypothetical protein
MIRRSTFYIFFAVLVFLMLSAPQNHCEAEDTYYYARMVEQGDWSEMFHQHHLLYLPIARGVVQTVQQFGVPCRALPVLIAMSMISAAWVICFFAALLRRSGQSRLWVLPLLFSYGFWRYACAAEIYLPALAFWICWRLMVLGQFQSSCSMVFTRGKRAVLMRRSKARVRR